MRILLLSDWYQSAVNGVVVSVENLRKGLENLGHEVRITTLSQDRKSYYEDGVYHIGSHDAGLIYPGARLRAPSAVTFSDEVQYWAPDILHTNCEFSTFFIALQLKKLFNVPIIHTYHTMYEDYTRYIFPSKRVGIAAARFYTKFVSEKIDRMIAPTVKVKDLLEDYGVPCPVSVIPTGIDLSLYSTPLSGEERNEIRKRYGIKASDTLFIYCGRLAAEKNIELLLKAFGKEREGRKLIIVGDGPVRQTLEILNDEIGSGAIFTGMLGKDEVSRCYRASDVFISASKSETQGLTFIEAAASSLPLICISDPVLEGVVENGRNGFLPASLGEMQEAIDTLTTDSSLRNRMAEESRSMAEAFSIETFAKRVEALYIDAISEMRNSNPQIEQL